MFKPSKRVAATLSAVAIAGTAGLVAVAPAAHAGTVNPLLSCDASILGTLEGNQSFTMTLTPETGGAPNTVKAMLDAGTNPIRPPQDFPNIGFVGHYTFGVSGGGADIKMDTTKFVGDIGPAQGIDPPAFEQDITLPAAAPGSTIDLTLKSFVFDIYVPSTSEAPLVNATCTVKSDNGVIASYKVADAPAETTLTTTPGEVKPGGAVTVSGTNWPAGTPKLELCDSTGAGCDETKVTGPLAVDADGKLSGTATIGAGVADGAYQLKVTVGDKSKTSNVSVKAEVPSNQRKVALAPNHGPVGTKVTVTGEGFTPNTQLYVVQTNAAQQPDVPSMKSPTTDAQGKFSVEVTIAKDDITLIAASEDTSGTLSAAAPFTVDGTNPPAGQLKQDITGTIAGGALTISQENGAIKLSDVTLNGTDQAMTGKLNTVTVKDFRAGNTGWTLTGAMTDFSNGAGGTIPAEKFTWTPKVATEDGSPSTGVAGSTGPIGKAGATLASAPNAETTGGTFKADADLSLAVPAYQAIGNYSATLTLSIS
jgi:hypothetical protein